MTHRISEEVQTLLNTPIPEKLWHYTSLAGAKGIVESKTLWATDIRFLNDRAEYTHALELLKSRAEKIPDEHDLRARFLERLNNACSTGVLSTNQLQVFVISFSTEKDLLSQWRAYCEEGKGLSIGFNLQMVRPPSEINSMVSLAPCVYKDSDKEKLIDSVIRHFLAEAAQIHKEIDERATQIQHASSGLSSEEFDAQWNSVFSGIKDEYHNRLENALNQTLLDFQRIRPLLKHSSFEEEAEWRLVLPYSITLPDDLKKKMRMGKHSLIPYVEMPLSRQTGYLAIEHILVGPTPVIERTIDSVKILLSWNELAEVIVEASSTSFRSW